MRLPKYIWRVTIDGKLSESTPDTRADAREYKRSLIAGGATNVRIVRALASYTPFAVDTHS